MEPKETIQDPNTPRYARETGLLTDYGKSLGLKEVNKNVITSDKLSGSGTPLTLPNKVASTAADGLQESVGSITSANKAESDRLYNERVEALKTKKSDLSTTLDEILGTNTAIATAGSSIDRRAEDKAKKEADRLTSEIEAEALSNRRRIEKLEKTNPDGLFGGALEDKIYDINARSVSKQADLAILQNSALRNYETANQIADRQLELKLEPLKAKLENLKFFYTENKADFNKEDDRLYNEAYQKAEREYKKEETLQNDIKGIKLEAAKNGADSSTIAKLGEAKTFDEAMLAAGTYLAESQNDIVKLDSGATLLIDKRTGKVIKNFGGGKATTPKYVARTVAGTPVTGYTLQAGDDPYYIAQQYGTTVEELKKINPNVKDWNNIQVGATLNVPQPEKDAFVQLLKATEGGKNLTDTSIQKLDKGLTVLGQLGVLQANVENVKTGPIVGAFKSKNPWDTQGQTIKASLNAIIPNLARGVYGEVGVLTDNDIAQYSKTIPNLSSTEEVRNAVLYITLDMIGKSIRNTLSVNAAAGRDVSGFVDIYTEMESAKDSILQGIPSAQVPQAFQGQDDFLNQFTPQSINSSINNADFFNQFQ